MNKKILSLLLCMAIIICNIPVFANEHTIIHTINTTENITDDITDDIANDITDDTTEADIAPSSLQDAIITAGGWSIIDGPYPIGELLGAGLIIYEGSKIIVHKAPSLFSWLKAAVGVVFNETKVKDGDKVNVKFPGIPGAMDKLTGVKGKRVLDTPATPGRNKTVWELPNGNRVVNEKHPYDKGQGAPESHTGWHWHVEVNGTHSTGYVAGQNIPDVVWKGLK